MPSPSEVLILLAVALIVAAILIAKLPVAECLHCTHCQEQKRRKELEQEKLRKEYARSIGHYRPNECPQCPHCNEVPK